MFSSNQLLHEVKSYGSKPILIVFAAGKGSRMQPLTLTKPKPLMDVGGLTLLERNIAEFASSVEKIVIVIGYLGEMIQAKIGSNYCGVPVEYVQQKNSKGGTLDAFRTALFYGQKNDSKDVCGYIVTNADDIHGQGRYLKFLEAINKNPQQALLVSAEITDIERLKTVGVVTVDSEENLQNIVEKPNNFISNLANVGIYYFPKNIINFVDKKRNETESDEHFITRDLIQPYNNVYPVKVLKTSNKWFIISTVQDLEWVQKNYGTGDCCVS